MLEPTDEQTFTLEEWQAWPEWEDNFATCNLCSRPVYSRGLCKRHADLAVYSISL